MAKIDDEVRKLDEALKSSPLLKEMKEIPIPGEFKAMLDPRVCPKCGSRNLRYSNTTERRPRNSALDVLREKLGATEPRGLAPGGAGIMGWNYIVCDDCGYWQAAKPQR